MRPSGVVLLLFPLFFQSACSQYTRDMFWENKVLPTPYDKAESAIEPARWSDQEITYSWLGHASVLINFYGTIILTDPVLLDRIAPPEMFDNLFGIKRIKALPLDLNDLPDIDLVLISHPHYDHLDLASLRLLAETDDYTLIVPALTSDLVDDVSTDANHVEIIELDWMNRASSDIEHNANKNFTLNNVTVSPFRIEHYGNTSWGDRQSKRGFNGYLISSAGRQTSKNQLRHIHKTIAFFGDTTYSRYRDEWGNVLERPESAGWRLKFSEQLLQQGIDLCVIPIGDSYYYWNHISPENAVRLANELNCKKLLPIHYSTFILTPPEKVQSEPKESLLNSANDADSMSMIKCAALKGDALFPDIGVSCRFR